ncbi:hypothetical protein [Psychrobacter sp. FDAARGOS_221]|uniref:hypothetical protein n=1 Tax=Psychrobacter sp. FDAARGOS_221 TaxID=1975705 RepID=UPI000BB577B9|nr:hypothetical protein [Psychrobacter sp. FDAARGOS_221]PNK59448.1 hypothetical protein A6J60_000115 [Psychrobacter sp. FDAARGOS_221]PNK61735.1 hypothetical protein A6J60_013265 [Psychrobacter sp. FDAARGOS_221]
MATLFQIHATMNTLKPLIRELGTLWQAGDSILLLGESSAYYAWAKAYIKDFNGDDEIQSSIDSVSAWYVLAEDIDRLNDSAKLNLDLTGVTVLSDLDWVNLTQKTHRVVTLHSTT